MAEFQATLLDLVEFHVRSEVEENLTWASPRQDDMDAAFLALFLAALQAALTELGNAAELRAVTEALK